MRKANLQAQKWTEKWEIFEEANSRTEEAIESLKQIDSLLIHTLSIDNRVDWKSLKKKEKYQEKPPAKPTKKSKKEYPPKPEKQSAEFTPVFSFFEKLFKSKKEKKFQEFEMVKYEQSSN